MPNRRNAAAAVIALIAWAGLILQLWLSLRIAAVNGRSIGSGLISYLGYFTILTNLFVALVTTLPWAAPTSRGGKWSGSAAVTGAAITAITAVGISYHVLLRNIWNPQGWQRVADITLHYVVPLISLAWWIIFSPREKVSWKWPLLWCFYPACYLIYALARGAILHTYPYYFIDVPALGYGAVLRNALGLFVVFVVLGVIVAGLAAWRNRGKG